ncbi:mechanosensitive ion channel family protein [Collinsella aerofaciens]|uniref:mechanosensitive ion channel family protein n=1 Tax=Collinsella aerofaciens TaxID=74426 RepID=UPI00359C7272
MELFEPILHFFGQQWVRNIIWAAILASGTAVAAKVASKTLHHLLNRDDNPLPSSSIFINIARAIIWMIGGSFILDNCFGINANAIVAALGVGGIAISLGFQDTLSNLIGGMQVTFMGIIKPGDNIEVGGVSGVVQDITWRHTTIEDACGQTIIVPNSNISKNTLVHLMPFGRVAVPVAVKDTSKWASLDALADELTCATKAAVLPISGFDKEPYVLFSEIGDFGIKGKIIFIVSDDSTTFTAADACIRAIAPIIA